MQPGEKLDEARGIVEEAAVAAGRDPAAIGMEGRVTFAGDAGDVIARARAWEEAGASHLSVNTMRTGLVSVDQHLAALEQTAEALGLKPA